MIKGLRDKTNAWEIMIRRINMLVWDVTIVDDNNDIQYLWIPVEHYINVSHMLLEIAKSGDQVVLIDALY